MPKFTQKSYQKVEFFTYLEDPGIDLYMEVIRSPLTSVVNGPILQVEGKVSRVEANTHDPKPGTFDILVGSA